LNFFICKFSLFFSRKLFYFLIEKRIFEIEIQSNFCKLKSHYSLKNKLNTKIVFTIITASLLIYALILGVIIYSYSHLTQQTSEEMINALVREKSNEVRARFEGYLGVARALATVNENTLFLSEELSQSMRDKLFRENLKKNELFLAVWDSRELSVFDENWGEKSGRVSSSFTKYNGQIVKELDSADIGKVVKVTEYHRIKEQKRESLSEPYWSVVNKTDSLYETTLSTPIFVDEKFAGVVGIDFSLNTLQEFTNSIAPFEQTFAFLLTNKGTLVTFNEKAMFGHSLNDIFLEENTAIVNQISKGEIFSVRTKFFDKKDYYVSFAPIHVGTYENSWALAIAVPDVVIKKAARERFSNLVLFASVGFVILVIVLIFLLYSVTKPVLQVTDVLKKLELGEIDDIEPLEIYSHNELGEMAKSTNNLVKGLHSLANFASQVGKGNYKAEYVKLSANDKLGSLLLDMRNSLANAQIQNQKNKYSDERRNWINTGLAIFAELLRSESSNVSEFSYKIISELIKYIKANQGAILIINDEDKSDVHLQLMATYAFERRKYSEKKIEIGESLVGQCVLEKEIIYLTDLPEEYTQITSGLGKSTPRNIMIVPLIFNEEVQGVIEIASFGILDKYEKAFIEKVSEAIAATFATIKINQRTTKLLEDSNFQAEQMLAQEEEMRQNMEQIREQQEETEHEIAIYKATIERLNKQIESYN